MSLMPRKQTSWRQTAKILQFGHKQGPRKGKTQEAPISLATVPQTPSPQPSSPDPHMHEAHTRLHLQEGSSGNCWCEGSYISVAPSGKSTVGCCNLHLTH